MAEFSSELMDDREPDDAKTHGGRIRAGVDGKNGTARVRTRHLVAAPWGSQAVEQVASGMVNPDASLSCERPGSSFGERHGYGGLEGSLDSVDWLAE